MIVLFRCLDLETEGLAPPAAVLEIGFTDVLFDTETKTSEIGAPTSLLFRNASPLTSDNIAVHHLTPAMLAGRPLCTPEDLDAAASFKREISDGVLAAPQFLVAANSAFEAQWITAPEGVRWICTVKSAARLLPDAPSCSNQAMRYELGLDLDPDLAMPPHRAGPDSYVTAHVLAHFLKTERVSHLAAWTLEPRWMPRCPLGKWRGVPWADVDHGFLTWMLRTPDLDADAVHWAALELQRRSEIT